MRTVVVIEAVVTLIPVPFANNQVYLLFSQSP
jgi:hypothetical protein